MTVADLSVRFDSSPVARGVRDLKDAAAASRETAAAVDSVGTATERAFDKFDKGGASGGKVVSVLERIEAEVKKVTAGVAPLSAALDKLDASINKLGKSQGGFGRGVNDNSKSFREHANAANDATAATEKFGKSQKQVANDIKIMQYQLIDVAQGLAMGQSPLMIAMQQGGQIAQAGGLRGAIAAYRALPSYVRYGGPALVGAGLGFAAYNRAQTEQQGIERSSFGAGAMSDIAPGQVNTLARRIGYDNLSGPSHLSYGQGLELTTGLRSQGIGQEGVLAAGRQALDLSVTLGKSVQEIIELYKNGAVEATKFYKATVNQVGREDPNVTRQIEAYERSGEKTKAFSLALSGLDEAAKKANGGLLSFDKSSTTVQMGMQRAATLTSYLMHGVIKSVDELTNASGQNAERMKSDAEKIKDAEEQKKKAIEATAEALKQQGLAITLPQEVNIALSRMNPLERRIAESQRAAGGGPAITDADKKVLADLKDQAKAQRELNDAKIRGQELQLNDIELKKQLTEQARTNALSMDAETRAVGKSAAEQARLQYVAQARIQAGAGGKAISEEVERQIQKEADAYSKLVDVLTRVRTEEQARFDRSQLGRTAGDQQIASALRPLGGIDDPRNAKLADEMRLTQDLQELKSTLSSGVSGFLTAIRQGQKPGEALANQAGQMVDRAINKLTDEGMSRLFKWGMGQFGLDKLSTTAQMNVQAGVVNVNGAGGLGAAGAAGAGGLSPGGTAPVSPVTGGPIPDVGTAAARAFARAGGAPAGSKITTPSGAVTLARPANAEPALEGDTTPKGILLPYKDPLRESAPTAVSSSGLTPFARGDTVQLQPPALSRDLLPETPAQAAARAAMPDLRGARTALEYDALGSKGFPFFGDSVSPFRVKPENLRPELSEGLGVKAARDYLEEPLKDAGKVAADSVTNVGDVVNQATPNLGNALSGLENAIGSAIGGVMKGIGGLGGLGIGGNATGTSYWRGGLTWVGEKGPELARLPTGTEIFANHRLPSLSAGSGGGAPAPMRVTHNVYNQSGAQVETRERQEQDGSLTMDVVVRNTEKSIASRAAKGRGDAKDVFSTNQAAMNRG